MFPGSAAFPDTSSSCLHRHTVEAAGTYIGRAAGGTVDDGTQLISG